MSELKKGKLLCKMKNNHAHLIKLDVLTINLLKGGLKK